MRHMSIPRVVVPRQGDRKGLAISLEFGIVTGKNADIFKYLRSDYYDMDADEIEEFYPELFESVDLEESVNENRAVVHNPRGIRAFIRQVEKKFPQYKGEIEQLEDDEIVFPDDEKLKKFFKGAREVKFVLTR